MRVYMPEVASTYGKLLIDNFSTEHSSDYLTFYDKCKLYGRYIGATDELKKLCISKACIVNDIVGGRSFLVWSKIRGSELRDVNRNNTGEHGDHE